MEIIDHNKSGKRPNLFGLSNEDEAKSNVLVIERIMENKKEVQLLLAKRAASNEEEAKLNALAVEAEMEKKLKAALLLAKEKAALKEAETAKFLNCERVV